MADDEKGRLYHVEVRVEAIDTRTQNRSPVWKPMRPSGGMGGDAEPYQFTRQEAEAWMRAYVLQSGNPQNYRITEIVPEEPKDPKP